MKVKVTSHIDPKKILEERGLGGDKRAVKFLASEVKRHCDKYVPMQQGTLKNTAQIVETSEGIGIYYGQPYAHYQYYGEVMAGRAPKHYTGNPIDYHGGPVRGKEWDKRMMADEGGQVRDAFAKYVGGKAK